MNDLGDKNVGATKRLNLTAHGKKVDTIGYIHDDVFRQTRLLPLGVTVNVRFVRAIRPDWVQNRDFQCNCVREEMQGQPRGVHGVSKRPQKEQHVFSNKTSGL